MGRSAQGAGGRSARDPGSPKPTFTPKAVLRPPAPRAPVGPVLPRGEEKFRHVRRNAWMLTLFSVASFPLLLFSQVRLMIQYHWFWIYSPCIRLAALSSRCRC